MMVSNQQELAVNGEDAARRQSQDHDVSPEEVLSPDEIPPPTGTGRPEDFPVNDYKHEVESVKDDDDGGISKGQAPSFQCSSSPSVMQGNKSAVYEKVGEEGVKTMSKFTLYETSTRFYLVGHDALDKRFRVLKIDRTAPPGHLNIFEDDIVYDKRRIDQLLNTIEEGNKNTGGMKLKCNSWGLLGFIRFTEAYYMLLITKRAQVAMTGGHYIYQVEATELIPLTTGSTSRFARDRNPEEARYLSILSSLDLAKHFYFSYTYNITRTLQRNIIRERTALSQNIKDGPHDYNEMFVWNHHLLEPASRALKNTYDWCIPIIHGYIEQASLDVFGRRVYMTIIARRSRIFAGARYLKRGTNDLGYVANDVETEQIVANKLTTSFHAPGPYMYASPCYTSFVQHRGSIPLYWTQDNTGVTPKPDIDINVIDPFYSPAAMHFNNLFERYGAPVYILNLIKQRERMPRESKLLYEYQKAIAFLNQSLPEDRQIQYKSFDMSRAAKTRGQDVIGTLEIIGEETLQKTGFFLNGGPNYEDAAQVQNGIARTNCIDCLDRTNAAQFVIGKRALGRQLQALGVIAGNTVEYDTDCVNTFTHMFHAHGDTIAIQYGGSHLVNTMSTYRKINEWKSQSRDMVESFKRYYHNSFLDSQRQEAYNLFLGNYIFAQGQPMLWDLPTDYYLHHKRPDEWSRETKLQYIDWFDPKFLGNLSLPPALGPSHELLRKGVDQFDDYWIEYYRPLALSSFTKIFSWKMSARPRYLPDGSHHPGTWDPSPFAPRKQPQEPESPGKKPVRKGVTIIDPHNGDGIFSPSATHADSSTKQSILRESKSQSTLSNGTNAPSDKSRMTQWTLNQFHDNSLNPFVTSAEEEEYKQYISHPLNIPLVVSAEEPSYESTNHDFVEYVTGVTANIGNTDLNKEFDISEEDFADYAEFLTVSDDPLDVTEEDLGKKRYKAYKQWLRGKSLFKQSKVDPESR
ncbi:polyphosphoinositide phosphatase [Tothia fuscella]|uniref:Polyphosphoinositide phosphatase n=1 Tax=Tothia fuscella TaxID=1048955 RepID=A0A9P4NPM3_9PEZI|nr:polyphosphoinositide phosphatase [Tothia fuscella]